ncbi:ABC-type nitrate/sulfonate/bicarbonate transport system, permease component [Quadrisphaera granulorum]|uniref:ABC-type nitrate/sulfonate/bicarbonate transport system permease component n=1 Tax=Quadrisphaera granulorum TaxID=317664 RepID=A0A316A2G6_9ACTN|nr:ABC transporter permease [Quadrisphaera granulorum]PWJ51160.1 ABC-type nitrate/sulfonate/bicarbonate transport system permease component [Quadrisphaera granulorum]SZE97810.1 ABC-type nitrate/sulfonate/bicarbonate transport system, permease component [Quadrisphaera granulorum]
MTTSSGAVARSRPRHRTWQRLVGGAGFALGLPVVLLLVWGIWASFAVSPFFPSPLVIGDAFVSTWVGPSFLQDVLPSLARLAVGAALSILLGVVLGTVIGLVRWLGDLLEPLLEFLRAIPPPVLIPIVAVLLGPTDAMKITVIVAGSLWPVLLNTIDGVRATDAVMTETARSFSLTRTERLRYLVLPAASPRIMTGVRQALSIALILMVISEMFFSSSGLGYRIVYFQRNYLIDQMWGGIVLLGLIGVLLAVVFSLVERRVLRWYHGTKEVARA